MIIDRIMQTLMAALTGLLGLAPSWQLGLSGLDTIGTVLGQGISVASAFFPVRTLAICLAAALVAQSATTVWRVVVFIYDKIPFKMT